MRTTGWMTQLWQISPCGSRITNAPVLLGQSNLCKTYEMSLLLQLLAQFLRCVALLCKKDRLKAVVAQNPLLTQQLIVLNRGRQLGPSISPFHRMWLASFSMFLSTRRLRQVAVVFRFSTFLRFKEFLVRQKYKLLFSSEKQFARHSLAGRVHALENHL